MGSNRCSGLSSAALPLAPGTVLRERYRLVELLGRGAHGFTYLAHHEFLNHPCVVKIVPFRSYNGSQGAARGLRSEASAGFRVNHPNVVRVLDGDVLEGIWYFVMEYVDGVDLGQALAATGRLDWRQAVRVGVDAARGLEATHRAGLVHRDVKPSNLILGTDGRVRVADLGVARLISRPQAHGGPGDDERTGTLAYAAPEVFTPGVEIGPAADLFSLGVTLYQMTTGSLPRGGSLYRTLLGSDGTSVAWPADSPPEVPGWLKDTILQLLSAVPEQRWESAGALADHLERPAEDPTARPVPAPSGGPEAAGLVVLPLENVSGAGTDDWLGHAIADHLARSLAQRHGAYVANLDQYLQTLERVRQRVVRPRRIQLLAAGRLSGAATVVEGTFCRSGQQLELRARVHQAGHDQPREVPVVQGALAALAELEAELYRHLTALLGLATADAPAVRVSARIAPEAEERFFTAKRAFLRGDYEAAMQLGEEALELDAEFGEAVGFVGVCCARLGRYDEAVKYNNQQQLLAARAGSEPLRVEAHANLGSMHYFRGEYEAANECLTRAAQAAEGLGLTGELASIRNNLGFVLLQLGRTAEAEDAYQRSVETHKKYGALVALIGPYNGLGHVRREQRRYDEACHYFRRALALAQESDDYVNIGVANMNLGHCALLDGRLDDAKHELAAALNILEQTSFWNGLARVYEYMADLNLRLSNWSEAARCAEQRIALARRHSNRRMEMAAWQQKAEALQRAGQSSEAEHCLAQARQPAEGD